MYALSQGSPHKGPRLWSGVKCISRGARPIFLTHPVSLSPPLPQGSSASSQLRQALGTSPNLQALPISLLNFCVQLSQR